jgi:hypothetical protein
MRLRRNGGSVVAAELRRRSKIGHGVMIRRYAILVAIYLAGLVPAYSVIAVLEGAVRGLWPLSTHDWIYQGSAFLVQAGGLLALAGVFAIPASEWAIRRLVSDRGAGGAMASAAVGAVSVFLGTCFFDPRLLLAFPAAFLVSTGSYGLIVRRTVRQIEIVSPAT